MAAPDGHINVLSRFDSYFECSSTANAASADPIPKTPVRNTIITANATCSYPKPEPILSSACVFDAEEIPRSKCCSDSSGDCSQKSVNLLICQYQAAQQYVRCTSTDNTNVTDCVVSNAEKATWLPYQFLIYSGSEKCPRAKKILTTLAISNVIALLSAALANTTVIKHLIGRKQMFEYTEIKLNFLSMFVSIGIHVSIPFIIGVLLEKQGYTVNWLQQVLIWTVRPRVAPVIAILGFINASWMETAVNEMVADLLFSVPALVFAVYAAFFPNKTTNPAKPAEYKLYHAGGIIMIIPGVIIAFSFLMGMCLRCAPFRAFKYPAQDLWRILRNPVRKLQKKEPVPQREVHISNFKGWYINFFGLGIILYIGSWLVWASFLNMSGDLYCPASLNTVATVLFVYPVILNVLRAFLSLV
ncbi:uncharacterized protein BDZ99DRAFT_217408 [Mytilinidion resinicola]|uniref:Uncharacterized protein n=1 Tax=Mytilinidion resinicola TaxID=574789 RepID=A0A6A6XZQ1_9PEZI|nr:uncharacterized protein BDZ99DRAFT_217408 [Mytilinidion resinicola]KAF2801768.1 hypothetical protein BDZ99DRAFT_217408 [Mytilinidion resinicola]